MATIYLSFGIEHACHNLPTISTEVSQSPISIQGADDRVMIFLKANFGIKEIAHFKREVFTKLCRIKISRLLSP